MRNDNREFTLETNAAGVVELRVNGKVEVPLDLILYIKTYIKTWEVATVGVQIVMNNAKTKSTEPSGKGTMRNLYYLFRLYYIGLKEPQC